MKKFWMVCAEGGNAPTVRHCSCKAAETEALRIASLSKPGTIVHILETVKGFQVPLSSPTEVVYEQD